MRQKQLQLLQQFTSFNRSPIGSTHTHAHTHIHTEVAPRRGRRYWGKRPYCSLGSSQSARGTVHFVICTCGLDSACVSGGGAPGLRESATRDRVRQLRRCTWNALCFLLLFSPQKKSGSAKHPTQNGFPSDSFYPLAADAEAGGIGFSIVETASPHQFWAAVIRRLAAKKKRQAQVVPRGQFCVPKS